VLTDSGGVSSAGGNGGGTAASLASRSGQFLESSDASFATGDVDFTFAGWIYPTAINSSGKDIVARNGGTEFLFELYAAPAYRIYCTIGSGVLDFEETDLVLNAWHFFAFWHDSVNDIIGYRFNSTVRTASHSTGPGTPGGTMRLGHGVASRYFDGRMQRVGRWNRVLTSGERDALFNAGAGADYPF